MNPAQLRQLANDMEDAHSLQNELEELRMLKRSAVAELQKAGINTYTDHSRMEDGLPIIDAPLSVLFHESINLRVKTLRDQSRKAYL